MPPSGTVPDERFAHRLRRRGWVSWGIYTVLLLLLATRAFAPTLYAGWTDTDALADVVCAGEGWRSLAEPLTCGWGAENANFWRPVAMAQFWFLRLAFGWNAAAWHLWAILLHVATAVLFASFVRRSGIARVSAAISGVLFVVHPLAVEVVPAVARNLEITFCLGFFGALRFAGSIWFWPFALMAIGSKEAAVLLVPALLALQPRRTPWLPLLGVFAVYFGVRHWVLAGLGGYGTAPGGSVGMIGAIELLIPSVSRLAPSLTGGGWVWVAAAWITLAGAVLIGLRSRHWRLVLAMALVVFGSFALYGMAGVFSRRLLYLPSAAWCVLVVVALGQLWRAGPRLGLSVFGTWLAAWIHGSPAWRPYTDWNQAGHAFDEWLQVEAWVDVPDHSTVWVVDRPARFDIDPRRFRYFAESPSLNHTAATYSIEAWVREFTGKTIEIRQVSTVSVGGGVSHATVSRTAHELVVDRPGSRRRLATRLPFNVYEDGSEIKITGIEGYEVWVWNALDAR